MGTSSKLKNISIALLLLNTVFIDSFHQMTSVLAVTANYSPSSIITSSNLTGTVTAIQDDPTSPDANWLTATSTTIATSLEVSLQDPLYPLQTGANLQTIKALVRKNAISGGSPTASLTLYDNNGGTRTQIGSIQTITLTDTPSIVSISFDANSLVDKSGKSLEVKITGTTAGTSSNKRTVEVGAVMFNAEYVLPPGTPSNFNATRIMASNVDLSWDAVSGATSYEVKRDGTVIYTGSNTSFSDIGLIKSTNYNYQVRSYNSSGYSATSSIIVTTLNSNEWVEVSSGSNHSIGLRADGTLWSWGYNSFGQLGLGDTTNRNTPTQVGTATDWKAISAGGSYSLALKTDGTLWSFGYNYNGQLGFGDTTNRNTPTQVGTATDWKSISAGSSHTLATKTNGTLWAWGNNTSGQLGLADSIQRLSPTQVGTATDWKGISAGGSHSLALKSGGTLWSFGNNYNGQLGLNDYTSRNIPTQVDTNTNWKNISAGYDHSLAIKTDGTLWSFGYNNHGKLGLNDSTDRNTPTQVDSDTDWKSVSAGSDHSLVLKNNGTLWSFGYNNSGQLGLNDYSERWIPTQVGTDTIWKTISTGGNHSLALKNGGTLWSFGYNNSGQLALGDTTIRLVPTQVVNSPKTAPTNFRYTTISQTSVKLDWDTVTNATSYVLKRNGTIVYSGSSNTFTENGITTPDVYDYEVYGINYDGNGPSSLTKVPVGLTKKSITLPVSSTSTDTTTDYFETWERPFAFTYGIYRWDGVYGTSKSGYFSFTSFNKGIHNSTASTSITVTGPATVSFWYSVSSELNYDKFSFLVDSTSQINGVSGNIGWTYVSYSIPSGNHTLTWKYVKDSSASVGSDAAFIDDLTVSTTTINPAQTYLPTGKYYYAEQVDDVSSVPFRISKDVGTSFGSSVNGLSVFNQLTKATDYQNMILESSTTTSKIFNYYYLPSSELSLTIPQTVNLGNTVINTTSKSINGTVSSLIVNDWRSANDGWHISVSATQFTEVTSGSTPFVLPQGSLKLFAPTVSILNGTPNLPTINGSSWFIDDGNGHIIASENNTSNNGEVMFSFPVNAVELSLNSSVKMKDTVHYPVSLTPYQSIITWSVIAGP